MDLKLNTKSFELLQKTAEEYGLSKIEHATGIKKVTLIDAGVDAKFTEKKALALGAKIADASMGCLGKTEINGETLTVTIQEKPAIAALSCQLAGWKIAIGHHKALGSGPARIPAKKPNKIIDKMGYIESPRKTALVLETDYLPGKEVCLKILEDTQSDDLVIAAFKGNTDVGLINILARVVEVGIFRLHNIGYDVKKISYAEGTVPIPLIPLDAMFKGNDAIIYQGNVGIKVDTWDSALTEKAVSSSSAAYGKGFQDIYNNALGDFYKIDSNIFAPAEINIVDAKGTKYHAGATKTIY